MKKASHKKAQKVKVKVKSKKAKEKRPAIWRGLTKGRKGSALLVVLFIVIAITILSLGFLSRSDVELACGENMILRTQMDYLAESGLEHARGLILNDSNYSENWTALRQRLYDGNDYYDVSVVKISELNWQITSSAYRRVNDDSNIAQSSLTANLRLDPAIGFWSGTPVLVTLCPGMSITGDVYGVSPDSGSINGDRFAVSPVNEPNINYTLLTSNFSAQPITDPCLEGPLSDSTTQVFYKDGDLEINNVNISGCLAVNGNLTVSGLSNTITAKKNVPAIYVNGNLIIKENAAITVTGLVLVDGQIEPNSSSVSITGSLFTVGGINCSGSGSGYFTVTAAPTKAAIYHWPSGSKNRWSPAAGAFFKSIGRL
jgi:hypothetical protein